MIDEIIKRFGEDLPPFWKKFRNISVGVGVVAATGLSIASAGLLPLGVGLISGLKIITIITGTSTLTSQLTSKDR